MTVTVIRRRSAGCIWKEGEALSDTRDDGSWWLLFCETEREIGPRGGLRAPAAMIEMEGPSKEDVLEELEAMGYELSEETSDA